MSNNRTPSAASTPVLVSAMVGFSLWGVGWLLLIVDRMSHLGWGLEVAGPLLVAFAIIGFTEHLVRRIGKPAVAFAAVGALVGAISTLPYAISPSNLSIVSGLRFGYCAYGIGLLCGFVALSFVAVALGKQLLAADKLCPAGCACGERIHASIGSTSLAAVGFLIWGLGFLDLYDLPNGSSYGWILATVGTAMVTIALANHVLHLTGRFGALAAWIGIGSAAIWSVGYLLEAINPTAGFQSSWYSDLFGCYGAGHLLSALSIALVLAHKAKTSRVA